MINVKSIIIQDKVIKQNIHAMIVKNSGEYSEEFNLPEDYSNCAVRHGSFEYSGNTVNKFLYYSPDVTKINISANSEIFIFLRIKENT